MKTNRLEVMRAYTLIACALFALLWLILQVGAVFPPEVIRDGWYVLAVLFALIVCRELRGIYENGFTATIYESSERAASWREIFGSHTIPIRSPHPIRANVANITDGLFYQIDLRQITPEQRARMVAHITRAFTIPAAEVDATLDSVGCPILADDVRVTVRNPQRWM